MKEKNLKIFDVVELKNNEKGTILNMSGDNCLIEIAGKNKRHDIINVTDIKEIIYKK